jgi:hypothetical protein
MTVDVPVCEKHRGYWWKRLLLMFLPLAVLGVIGIMLLVLLGQMTDKDAPGIACGGTVVLGVVWLVVAAIVQTMMIRPVEITDHSIDLKNVSGDFVAAFEGSRRRGRRRRDIDDEDDEYEPPPRHRREPVDDDRRDAFRAERDDEPPPRRPQRRDTFRAEPDDD